MLKTKNVTIEGQDFHIASLSVRQYGAMMEARRGLYGDAATKEDMLAKNIPVDAMLKMEAEFVIVPSLNNASKQAGGTNGAASKTADQILDEYDNATFRGLVNAIFDLIGIKVEPGTEAARGPQLVNAGEPQAAAPTT